MCDPVAMVYCTEGAIIMSGKRAHRQNCALAIALDVLGERWTLLIARELLLAPRRFGELLDNLPGIGTNLLSARLQHLQQLGVIRRTEAHPSRAAYQLTESGKALEPVVFSLIRWGLRFPQLRQTDYTHRAAWDWLVMRACFNPAIGRQWTGAYRLRLPDAEWLLACRDDELVQLSGDDGAPMAAEITLSDDALQQWLQRPSARPPAAAEISGCAPDQADVFFAAFAANGAQRMQDSAV